MQESYGTCGDMCSRGRPTARCARSAYGGTGGTTFGLLSRSESLQVSATALARVLVGNCRTDALVELLGEDRCRLGSDDNFAW
jgi:hypothetical protein